MIKSFKYRGLEKLFLKGTKSGSQPKQINRIPLILARLGASTSSNDMDLPGLRLNESTGSGKGIWSVSVSGNWRMTFHFEGVDAVLVE